MFQALYMCTIKPKITEIRKLVLAVGIDLTVVLTVILFIAGFWLAGSLRMLAMFGLSPNELSYQMLAVTGLLWIPLSFMMAYFAIGSKLRANPAKTSIRNTAIRFLSLVAYGPGLIAGTLWPFPDGYPF